MDGIHGFQIVYVNDSSKIKENSFKIGEIREKSLKPLTILSEMYPRLWEDLAHTVMINCDAFGVPFTFLLAKHSSHGQNLQMQYVRITKVKIIKYAVKLS